jgi:hypothetical protein
MGKVWEKYMNMWVNHRKTLENMGTSWKIHEKSWNI